MANVGRNALCGCGSGRKAKRCCGLRRGPGPALPQADGPERRAELARGVLALADTGRVPPSVAAVAVVDLSCDSSSLLRASLLHALAVSVGAARTPAGLLVVSR